MSWTGLHGAALLKAIKSELEGDLMHGYTKCPSCGKFLFEEDFQGEYEKKCRWCGIGLNPRNLNWRGAADIVSGKKGK